MGGRAERILIDRLKPAQVDPTKPVQLQPPARRRRPPALPGQPSVIEMDDTRGNLWLKVTTDNSHHVRGGKCDCLCASSNSVQCLCWGEELWNQIKKIAQDIGWEWSQAKYLSYLDNRNSQYKTGGKRERITARADFKIARKKTKNYF
ncbi:hypothetical protein PoB_001063100 [Plakobranchus ocellatus]|uniref:Uncharacterized protein n=1 Tax=Plakobranchus ocellatus TaxID=259542 RepID=A0AAV3YA43_9GAST|nr:hypothetical protein PoB_001063100 [Plakobranchus ocellatus]